FTIYFFFFFSSRRRHTRSKRDWSSDVCSSDLVDETSARRERRKNIRPSQRHRILVIDDSLMLLGFVEEILAEANYDVVTAGTAQEGLQAIREQKPDLILLDYLLPDLRGDEVSRLLSEDESTAHIPVLFMSGFGADLQ